MRTLRPAVVGVLGGIIVLAIGLAAGLALGSARQPARATTVTVTKVPSGCTQAIARADTSLAAATRVAGELAEHTRIMDDLIAALAGVNNGMTAHKALTQGMTSINNGRADRRIFAETRTAYDQVKQACRSE